MQYYTTVLCPVLYILVGTGATGNLPAVMEKLRADSAYVFADRNTSAAAGKPVCQILQESGTAVGCSIFKAGPTEPNEHSVGLAAMCSDP